MWRQRHSGFVRDEIPGMTLIKWRGESGKNRRSFKDRSSGLCFYSGIAVEHRVLPLHKDFIKFETAKRVQRYRFTRQGGFSRYSIVRRRAANRSRS